MDQVDQAGERGGRTRSAGRGLTLVAAVCFVLALAAVGAAVVVRGEDGTGAGPARQVRSGSGRPTTASR